MLEIFDRVYVLNLADRTDRCKEIESQLRSVGYRFDSRIQLFPATRPTSADGFRNIGARGCFLSHLGALRAAMESNAESLLILEDDVDFASEFVATGATVRASLKTIKWSVFYGGHSIWGNEGSDPATVIAPGVRLVGSGTPISLGHFIAFRGDTIARVHDYLKAQLARPPGHEEGGPMDVDGAYSWFRKHNPDVVTIVADPQLGYQRASKSDIFGSRWYEKILVVRDAISWLRRVKNRVARLPGSR